MVVFYYLQTIKELILAKKTYVLDTNVYLTDAESILAFENNDILVPLKVLDEIDKHKKRQDTVGVQARRNNKGKEL
mgnify:CR=1 FL=1